MSRTVSVQKILADLVAIPSVHPEADSGGTTPGEAAMAQHVAETLRRLGAEVRLHALAPGRSSVVAVFEPSGQPAATVALVPHLDTVGVDGMTVPPFQLTRRGTRLQGRGACDTKGPMAALLAALSVWAQSRRRLASRTRWIFAATAGEEQGSLGAEALMKEGFSADFAVALEPTQLRVVSAAKGLLRLWIDVPGRAAHGATPERGRNAVFAALPLLAELRDQVAPALAARVHPVLGRASLNLGIVAAGSGLNVVPANCRLGLDLRLHPGCEAREALHLVRAAIATHAPDARLSLHRQGPSFVTERTLPWARTLRRVGRGWATADWFCDGNVFASRIPAVAFGPGRIEQAHTRDEFIEESELEAGVGAFRRLLDEESAAPQKHTKPSKS